MAGRAGEATPPPSPTATDADESERKGAVLEVLQELLQRGQSEAVVSLFAKLVALQR